MSTFAETLTDVSADPDAIEEMTGAKPVRRRTRRLASVDATAAGDQGDELPQDVEPDWQAPPPVDGDGPSSTATRRTKRRKTQVKVTAAMRKDIKAKVALGLTIGGNGWKVRDPLCGDAFLTAAPEVSEALTDIFCDSPDIVRWFTAGGGYMKWLNLLQALQPVLMIITQHHITHSVGGDQDQAEGDPWSGYSADG
jgi:hypothetical protein